jgi:16S rRNA pseudouridine516 synthase
MIQQRLDNFLIQNGFCSKRGAKNFVLKNKVCINGTIEKNYKANINPQQDEIFVNEKKIETQKHIYLVMNKPSGYVCSTVSDRSKTVYELLENFKNENPKEFEKLHTVGRLDKDTEGLLLITNDGQLAHELLSPKKHVDKTYFAMIDGEVKEEHKQLFLEGLDIGDDDPTMPAKLEILKSGETSEIELTIQEGRFHQVKRMFEAIGTKVTYLKRISMGPLSLGDLQPGEVRVLTETELEQLKNR